MVAVETVGAAEVLSSNPMADPLTCCNRFQEAGVLEDPDGLEAPYIAVVGRRGTCCYMNPMEPSAT